MTSLEQHSTSTTTLSPSSGASSRSHSHMRFYHIDDNTNDIESDDASAVSILSDRSDTDSRSDCSANVKRKGTPSTDIKPVICADKIKYRLKRSKYGNSLSPNGQDHPNMALYTSERPLNPTSIPCEEYETPYEEFEPRRRSMRREIVPPSVGFDSQLDFFPAPRGSMADAEADSDSYDSRSGSILTSVSSTSSTLFTPTLFDNMHLSPGSPLTIAESPLDTNAVTASDCSVTQRNVSTSCSDTRSRSESFCDDHEINFKMQVLAAESFAMSRRSCLVPMSPVKCCLFLGSVLSPPESCGIAITAETRDDLTDGPAAFQSDDVFKTTSVSTSPGAYNVLPCSISSQSLEDCEESVARGEYPLRPFATEIAERGNPASPLNHADGPWDEVTDIGVMSGVTNGTALRRGVPISTGSGHASLQTPLKTQISATTMSQASGIFSTPQSTRSYYACSESAMGWKESAPATEFALQNFCQLLQGRDNMRPSAHEGMHC